MFTKDLYLAGGSYYGLQEVFSRVYGVVSTEAGFANSMVENPTKAMVSSGSTGAVECVKVTYNPKKIDIGMLLNVFFTIINPYTDGIQGKFVGTQYRSGVFYTSKEDVPQISYFFVFLANRGVARQMTEDSLVVNEFEGEGKVRPKIRTEMGELKNFYAAPEEEQYYLRNHPDTYTPVDISLLEKLKIIQPAQQG